MRTYIFTDRERRIMEAYVTSRAVDNIQVSKIMHRIRKYKTLFEDVYLYLARARMVLTPMISQFSLAGLFKPDFMLPVNWMCIYI